jgi:hypothetical protein
MEIIDPADQRAALDAVFSPLEPGGRFICTLHNPAVRRRSVDGVLRLVGSVPGADGTLVVSGVEQGGDPVKRGDPERRLPTPRAAASYGCHKTVALSKSDSNCL